jgi:hypothetical protein
MFNYKEQTGIKVEEDVEVLTMHEDPWHLIVWNDEVNSFEWVIETLMGSMPAIPANRLNNAHSDSYPGKIFCKAWNLTMI